MKRENYLSAEELAMYKIQLNGPGGNEINNNWWARRLADHFPEIQTIFDGEPVVLRFLDQRFIKDPGGAVSEESAEYEAAFDPGFGHEYRIKRYDAEIGDEEALRRAKKYASDKGVKLMFLKKVRTSSRYLHYEMPF